MNSSIATDREAQAAPAGDRRREGRPGRTGQVRVIRTPEEMRHWCDAARRAGESVGLVPTMGSLHAGHVSLLAAARAACDRVVMSLFVNPTQFGSSDDLARYPRNEQRDLELAAEAGVDLVYAPATDRMYPSGFATAVEVGPIPGTAGGESDVRGPGHFRGVATVVAKLFNTIDPDRAYFGQKDAQQAAVVRRMVADLEFRQEVVVLPTVRDRDGLALSSRNARLDPDSRRQAAALPAALFTVKSVAGEHGLGDGLEAGRARLAEAGLEADYLEARDPDTLEPLADSHDGATLVIAAVTIGGVRLIDNLLICPKKTARSSP